MYLATIEALAAAIDAKDQMTRVHIRRVQAFASGLAEALNLSPGEIQAVRTAALLHDIGKLAIPAHILSKPGPLTPAIRQTCSGSTGLSNMLTAGIGPRRSQA